MRARVCQHVAMTQAKDLKSDLLPGLNDSMLDLTKRLEKAKNENDKIYFDKVPALVPSDPAPTRGNGIDGVHFLGRGSLFLHGTKGIRNFVAST